MEMCKEIDWQSRIEPKEKAGNWRFLKKSLTLWNIVTDTNVHLICLTTPARLLEEIFRLMESPKEGIDLDGFLQLFENVVSHHFKDIPRHVFCDCGEAHEVFWSQKKHHPWG